MPPSGSWNCWSVGLVLGFWSGGVLFRYMVDTASRCFVHSYQSGFPKGWITRFQRFGDLCFFELDVFWNSLQLRKWRLVHGVMFPE